MTITQAFDADLPVIIHLLKDNNLPVDDIVGQKQIFFIAQRNGQIIGAIGLEAYGREAILRSLVVDEVWRNQSVGTQLYNHLMHFYAQNHFDKLFLLTRTAQRFFERLGWSVIDRCIAPTVVQASAEFSHLCPVSAVCMYYSLHSH